MMTAPLIAPPTDASDSAGAVRVFQQFLEQYQAILVSADHYFEQIMEQIQPQFAQAYLPWQRAVKDLLHGTYTVARKIPLKNPKALADAMRLFSLDSAVGMLHDICTSCKLKVARNWVESFKENIKTLSTALRMLMQQQVIGRVR